MATITRSDGVETVLVVIGKPEGPWSCRIRFWARKMDSYRSSTWRASHSSPRRLVFTYNLAKGHLKLISGESNSNQKRSGEGGEGLKKMEREKLTRRGKRGRERSLSCDKGQVGELFTRKSLRSLERMRNSSFYKCISMELPHLVTLPNGDKRDPLLTFKTFIPFSWSL